MSERRRRYSFYEVQDPDPIIEERIPERPRPSTIQRRTTVIVQSTPVHYLRRERVERAPSPPRFVPLPPAPTPPPRIYTQLPFTMPPKQSPAPKPALKPSPKSILIKKDDVKVSDKNKDKPRVKIYEKVHKRINSNDTGYASELSSPYTFEDRSPMDYTTAIPKDLRTDTESCEIITGSSRPRYVKLTSERRKDTQPTSERRKDVRYVSRTPDSPGLEDEYVPGPTTEARKDRFAGPRKTTLVLQKELAKDSEMVSSPEEDFFDENRIQQLETELRKVRLERQIAENRSTDAKIKSQRIEDLNRRESELKQRIVEEQRRMVETISPREAELVEKQWKEISGSPKPSLRRSSTLIEQPSQPAPKPQRRPTLMTAYNSTALTTSTQSPNVLATENPFLAPILEAQRDEDARRAREERRRGTGTGTTVRETGRTARQRPRNDDRYI